MLLWVARWIIRPRPRLFRTPVDVAMLGFFTLTFITALTSYDPDVSIGKLRAASLFTVVYLVAENISHRRVLRALVVTLIASCVLNVLVTFGTVAVGRGVKARGLSANSLSTSPDFAKATRYSPLRVNPLRALKILSGQSATQSQPGR